MLHQQMQAKLCGSDSNPYLLSPFDDLIKRREQTTTEYGEFIRIIDGPEHLWRNCNLSKGANVKNQLQKESLTGGTPGENSRFIQQCGKLET